MDFTYKAYENIIQKLYTNGYEIIDYHKSSLNTKTAILRHDVDMSIDKAVKMAELEKQLGVKATYFILLSTDFYNVVSKVNRNKIIKIADYGAEIGLHFDESKYYREIYIDGINYKEVMTKAIKNESNILSDILGLKICSVSMHRPTSKAIETDFNIEGLINTYSMEFFNGYKYVSDSRMNWREDIYEIIGCNIYKNLHILTHPIWYNEVVKSTREILLNFIDTKKFECYVALKNNLKDISEFILESELR